MTYEEFRKKHPATRCFQLYSSEQRADLASSHRLTRRQREAIGEYYYLHPMVPDRAFPTAKAATTTAFRLYESSTDKAALAEAVLPPKVVFVTIEEPARKRIPHVPPRFAAPAVRIAVERVRVEDVAAEEEAAEIESVERAKGASR